ncbi:proline-rich protein PRCC-like [Branchiostoma floridae]|uniref:Proline-rich protein PRCC-like n=1 Tax=Branchiostoma floridae TaxID=7739 RepID=A0A9J7KNE1_BRAFL|nr:proline-rich protein PRCC-like [Branchiostoma floridae]
MALVAYGSSGESGSDSDDEEAQRPPPSLGAVTTSKPTATRSTLGLPPPKNIRSGEGSGMRPFVSENKDVEAKRKGRIGLQLPPPKTQNADQNAPKASRSSLFSTLPPPKSSNTTAGVQSSHETGNKSKRGSLVGPKRREPIKIAIPALPEPDSDEEDEPVPKKQKASVQGSGLASLLPAPKGSAAASIFSKKSVASSTITTTTSSNTKENTTIFNKKEDFVPYTLTKQKPPSTTAGMSSTKTQFQNSTASPSTAVSKKKNPVGVGPAEPIQTASAAKLAKLNMLKKLTKEEESAKDDGSDDEDQSTNFFSLGDSKDADAGLADPSPGPVPFSVEPTLNYSTAPGYSSSVSTSSTFSGPYVDPNQYNQYSEAGAYMQYNQPYDYSDYNQQPCNDGAEQEGSSQQQLPSQPVAGPYVQDEMFVRMQGKKNRGEEIKIIDVHEDSQRAKMEDWKVQMDAEEREFMLSRSKKSGKLPSRQQRNKHQITYLAFQAKERELELKNQWSQNRMTKRQTQAKYGF